MSDRLPIPIELEIEEMLMADIPIKEIANNFGVSKNRVVGIKKRLIERLHKDASKNVTELLKLLYKEKDKKK